MRVSAVMPPGRQAAQICPGLVSHMLVTASGVPAEWVETTVAVIDQPTLVYFLGSAPAPRSLLSGRPLASSLAARTGARVLVVGHRPASERRGVDAVEDGIDAYAWLLGEGCDVDATSFINDPTGDERAVRILLVARELGLPVPGGGVWGSA